MRKRSSLLIVSAVIGAVLIVFAIWFSYRDRPEPVSVNAEALPTANVTPVTRGSISHSLSLAGEFQPYQVVDVHAKVSGYIRRIYVDIGDKVHTGETLAVLEVPELDAQVKGTVAEVAHSKDEITRAQHDVVRAQSEAQSIHADYERLKQASAAQPGLIAQQELDDAQAKDLSSAAQVDAAKSALAAAEKQSAYADADNQRVHDLEAYTNVASPLNGVIVWRYADTGALIQAGTTSDVQSLPIVKLSQSDLLRLRLPVPEDAVQYIHEGDEVPGSCRRRWPHLHRKSRPFHAQREYGYAHDGDRNRCSQCRSNPHARNVSAATPRSSLSITTTHSLFQFRQ